MSAPKRVCVARIGAAHGVRGEVRLWPFTADPLAVRSYGPLSSADGRRQFEIAQLRAAKNHLVASLRGVTTRSEAETLNGVELYVARDRLPPPDDDEYYHADLIGLRAETAAGEGVGEIVAVHNFGAGDIIEIAPAKGPTLLLPFTDAAVPALDFANGRAVVNLPGEIEDEDRH